MDNRQSRDPAPYYVERIEEADFGCEERQPGEKLKCRVTLQTPQGRQIIEVTEEALAAAGIEEGSRLNRLP